MMSFGPFATQIGQHPVAPKAVCSVLVQVTGAHAWMSQVDVTGTSCAWHQSTESGDRTGFEGEGRRRQPSTRAPSGAPASVWKGAAALHSRSQSLLMLP